MLRLEIKVADLSDKIAKVTIDGVERTIGLSQVQSFEVPDGGSVTIDEGDMVDRTVYDELGNAKTDVSEGNHGNPNGISSAAVIAPKGPKPGGETSIVKEGGVFVERQTTEDLGQQTQGGGVEAEAGLKTPGPKIEEEARGDTGGNAQALGADKASKKK